MISGIRNVELCSTFTIVIKKLHNFPYVKHTCIVPHYFNYQLQFFAHSTDFIATIIKKFLEEWRDNYKHRVHQCQMFNSATTAKSTLQCLQVPIYID